MRKRCCRNFSRGLCLLLFYTWLTLVNAEGTDSSAATDVSALQPSSIPADSSLFSVVKSSRNSSSELTVILPPRHPLYDQFTAKVVDVTENIESSIRDVNKTFLTSVEDATTIKIHHLHAGHKYSISVIGRKGDRSEWIKEETVEMDPKAPEFAPSGIISQQTNITMKTIKNENNVQDSFLVEYRAIDPEKKYPILEIMDLPEQKELEIYLGNLFPGRSYSVRVIAVRGELKSKPWVATVTTKPESVFSLTATDLSSPCVALKWTVSPDSGADAYLIQYYSSEQETTNASKITVSSFSTSAQLCESIVAGSSLLFSVQAKKNNILSEPTIIEHTIRPLSPTDFKIRPDTTKGRYRLSADIPINTETQRCQLTVVSETLEKVEQETGIDERGDRRSCTMLLALVPGQRYEFAVSTLSHGVASTRLSRSIALAPAFDLKGFGLTVQEIQSGIEVIWPQSEAFLIRLKDLWNKLVGTDSVLRLRVIPQGNNGNAKQEKTVVLEGSPHKNQPLVVSSLRKGACYKIQLFTVTKTGIISEARYNESFRISSPSVNVTLEAVTRTESTLRLNLVGKHDEVVPYCYVSLVVLDMHSTTVLDKKIPLATASLPLVNLIGLRPFHKYTVNTQVVCGGLSSSGQCPPSTRTMRQLSFSTRQDKPGAVQNLKVRSLNPYSVQVSWLPPALPNGILTNYVVEVKPEDDDSDPFTVDVAVNSADKNDHTVEAVVDQLVGGERYTFSVKAVTEAGAGETDNAISLTQPLLAPPRPSSIPQIVPDSVGSQSVSIRYSGGLLNPKHGRIMRTALIVSEVTPEGKMSESWLLQSPNTTYTWTQVQRFDVWPAYTATLNVIPKSAVIELSKFVTESVGVDRSCAQLLVADSICNGPLKSAASYRFKLRLYTAPNLWTDTEYSDTVTTYPLPRDVSLQVLVSLLTLFILFGLAAILAIVYWSRRSKKARSAAVCSSSKEKESQWVALKMMMAERAADCLAKLGLDSQQAPDPQTVAATSANSLAPNFHHRRCRSLRERTGVDHRLERLPSGSMHRTPLHTVMHTSNSNISRPVRIEDFAEHVSQMSRDSEFHFSEEYELLKNVGCGQSNSAAEAPVNRTKNRFTNILPYDHSRVKLVAVDDEDGSDYINANFMPGFSSRREFIAAQGPLPSTRDAFWQMVWEQQCPAIIALTKCVEKGRDKCHQYWPDAERMSVMYADIDVTLLCETHYDEFTVRELRLTSLKEPSQVRTIRHFHYMAWPDFGVPEHPDGILRLAHLFRAKLPHSPHNKPTIVHCSAGVGRSGTFIAIDRLLQNITLSRPVDVFGIVNEMRMERCHMVQNEQQYIFIHHCLLFAIQHGGSSSVTNDWLPPVILQQPMTNGEIHQNPAFEDDEGIAESGF